MRKSTRKQDTPKTEQDPAVSFRLPERLRKQIEDAAWDNRLRMSELLRCFAEEGMKKLTRESAANERNATHQTETDSTLAAL